MIRRLLNPGQNRFAVNLALLILRVWLGAALLLLHGMAKLTTFGTLKESFPDPIGAGSAASLSLAIFAEVFCAFLIVVGLLTRFAAAVQVILMAVAFAVVHKFALQGAHSGELAFIYLAGFVVLLLAGPGAYSLDRSVTTGLTKRQV